MKQLLLQLLQSVGLFSNTKKENPEKQIQKTKEIDSMFTKPKRPVSRVFLHCSASDNPMHDDISVMRKWHVEGNGWSDVGYHAFIKKDGTLQMGRPLERTPAAQKGHNLGTIAICCHGLDVKKFTDKQRETLYRYCTEINNAYNKSLTFHGHCEVSLKSCPVFDYKDWLKLDRFGRMKL